MNTVYRLEERRHDGQLLGVIGFYRTVDNAIADLRSEVRRSPYLYQAGRPRRLVVLAV